MTDKKLEYLIEIDRLRGLQNYFNGEGYTRAEYIGKRLRFFPVDEDFEKKYLQEAADKISAVYEEKIWQKVQELSAEYEPKKLGYSFTWLTKLKSAANDEETEKILQDWLAELAEKKSAEK